MDRAATIIPLALARISIFWFILLAADYYSYDLHWAWDEPQFGAAEHSGKKRPRTRRY
jgi:hypothetical protein